MKINDTQTCSASNDKAITSNCSILAMLSHPPKARTPTDEVVYSHYDIDKERCIIVEHKVKSVSPLTSTAVRLLAFLIRHLDPDTNEVVITGNELFTELGRTAELYEAIQALKRIDILNKITDTDTQWSVYHRLGVIESATFEDDYGCTDWDAVREETTIRLRIYDAFARVYVHHIIDNLNISLDFVALSQNGVMEDVAEELKDAASAPTDSTDGAITDGAVTDDEDAGANDEAAEEEDCREKSNEDAKIDILISLHQLNRMFSDGNEDDFEIDDGALVKYHGEDCDVVIPQGVVMICNDAFEDCTCLKSVKIPNSVKMIGENSFRNCENLVEMEMPLSLLKLVMPYVDFYFSGTPIAELLKKDGLTLNKFDVEITAKKRIEAADKGETDEG